MYSLLSWNLKSCTKHRIWAKEVSSCNLWHYCTLWQINMEHSNHILGKRKSSSKPSLLGSMLISLGCKLPSSCFVRWIWKAFEYSCSRKTAMHSPDIKWELVALVTIIEYPACRILYSEIWEAVSLPSGTQYPIGPGVPSLQVLVKASSIMHTTIPLCGSYLVKKQVPWKEIRWICRLKFCF